MSPGPYDPRLVAALSEERLAAAQRTRISRKKPPAARKPQPEVSRRRAPVVLPHHAARTVGQH